MPLAIIFTAFPFEYKAIRNYLIELKEEVHPHGTIYERGIFYGESHRWKVIIAEIGSGNVTAASEVERAVTHFKPNLLLFVGIAEGIKGVAVGDVVAATKVYSYESGKVENEFLVRPEIGQSAYALVQRARAEAKNSDWLKRISSSYSIEPNVVVAPIAAGEKSVSFNKSELIQFLEINYNDAVAIEIGGFGFLKAAFSHTDTLAIVIRGIFNVVSDDAGLSLESESVRKEKASLNASAFAFEVISKTLLLSQNITTDLTQKELCNLPHRYTNSFVGRKKEIDEILIRVSNNYRQHLTVLKGIGGVGKTALALEVAYKCWEVRKEPLSDHSIPKFDAIIFSSSKATNLIDTKLLDRPEKEPTLSDIFRVIAETLNDATIMQVAEEQQLEQVNRALRRQKTLLIIDNMETLDLGERDRVLSFLNNVPHPTQVIITTREHLGIDAISIKSLTRTESIRLISEQCKAKNVKIKGDQKKQLYKMFGGIPIALIYAVGQRAAGYKFSEFIKPTDSLPEELGRFCFETSVEPLKQKSAYKILLAMTFFRSSPCYDALVKVAGISNQAKDTKDSLAKLLQLSLLAEKDERYFILSITREYAIVELEKYHDNTFYEKARQRWIDWYLLFTKQYGGLDWDDWRTKHQRIEEEWSNIESVLYWCASEEKWAEVLKLWENIDCYVDLNGYWQKRRHWWTILAKKTGDPHVQAKALSEKAWTLILMGENHFSEAEESLRKAWDLREATNLGVQACISNYFAVLEKNRRNLQESYKWLERERAILRSSQLDQSVRIRYMTRNYYYFAELKCLEGDFESAQEYFQKSIHWGEKVKWQRFINYAHNGLACALIEINELTEAERLLRIGLSVAENMEENRRIALYYAGFAKLYYKFFVSYKSRNQSFSIDAKKHALNAIEYAKKALEIFVKEDISFEQEDMKEILLSVEAKSFQEED